MIAFFDLFLMEIKDILHIKTENKKNQKRNCNTIWFNPPSNKDVSTNVAKKPLHLLNEHDFNFCKILNRNIV